jgi:hypothetical protein
MLTISPVDDADLALLLRRLAVAQRRFLDADPISESVPTMCRRFRRNEAMLLGVRRGSEPVALAGLVPLVAWHRWGFVDVVPLDGVLQAHTVVAVLDVLRQVRRVGGVFRVTGADDELAAVFRECGFRPAGILREYRFAAGAYRDETVLYRPLDPTLPGGRNPTVAGSAA